MQFNMKGYGFLLLGVASSSYALRTVSPDKLYGVNADALQPSAISRQIELC